MSPSAKEQTLGSRNGEPGTGAEAGTAGAGTDSSGWLAHTMGSQSSTKKLGRQGLDQKVKRLQVSQAPCQTGLAGARIYYIVTQSVSLWCHMRVGASVSSPGDHTLSASYRKSFDGNEKEGRREGRGGGRKGRREETQELKVLFWERPRS